ncbi:MAG: hypothetical protein WCA46_11975, partial [Actinocatenispora sp.]
RTAGRSGQVVRAGVRDVVRHVAQPTAPSPALVDGTFELVGGTGRFARVAGRGVFRGWAIPEVPALSYSDGDVD